MATVGVYCGSNPGNDPDFWATAVALGTALGRAGHTLVFGGSRVGLMGALADAVLEAGGTAVGYLPHALAAREIAHTGLTELLLTSSMHERKAAMAERSDGFVALPGGYGTLDEVLEILTWNQIGLLAKPVALLDVNGYYEALFEFFDRATESGLVMPAHRRLAQRASTVAEALAIATGPAPANVSKWTDPTVRV